MADFTDLQGRLRMRGTYLSAVRADASGKCADGDTMLLAAEYIDRLERDKSRLVEEVATVTRARDLEIRCRLDNAHLLTEAGEKLAAVTAERDQLYEAPRMDRILQAEEMAAHWEKKYREVEELNKPLKRYYVDRVMSPIRTGVYDYLVRDRAVRLPYTNYYRVVASSRDGAIADKICDMLNAAVQDS